MSTPRIPVPDAVANLTASHFPPHVVAALEKVQVSGKSVSCLSRLLLAGEMPADARRAVKVRLGEDLGKQAAANKVLAAYNPGLIVRIGGDR